MIKLQFKTQDEQRAIVDALCRNPVQLVVMLLDGSMVNIELAATSIKTESRRNFHTDRFDIEIDVQQVLRC